MSKKLTKGQLLELETYTERLFKNFGLDEETFKEVKSKIYELYPDAPEVFTHTEL